MRILSQVCAYMYFLNGERRKYGRHEIQRYCSENGRQNSPGTPISGISGMSMGVRVWTE